MTDVWVLLIHDRHHDIVTDVYTERQKALAAAEEALVEYGEDRGGYRRDPAEFDWSDPTDDCPFSVTYSCEGDYINVRRQELNTSG